MARRLKLSFDDLSRLRGRLEDPRPALQRVGALMLAASQKSFDDQAYGPERWPERYEGQSEPFINIAGALSDVARDRQIKERRFDRRPALVDTATLRGSLTFALKGKKSVSVGTTDPKAPKHLFGLKSVQAVTDVARERLVKEYRRFKKRGGARFEAFKKLGFLHTFRQLETNIQRRAFLGLFPDLEKSLTRAVEDFLAEGAA